MSIDLEDSRHRERFRRRSSYRACALGLAGWGFLAGCSPEPPSTPAPTEEARNEGAPSAEIDHDAPFFDEATDSGFDFQHFNGATGRYYMAEVTGSGAAVADFDGDGDLDIYMVQGNVLDPSKSIADAELPLRHDTPGDRLYRNELMPTGELRFVDVTATSGLRSEGFGMGVAVGDVENDGDLDIYITNFGPNELWLNQGDGTFVEGAAAAGVAENRWSVPALFFDFDGDGFHDLFVGNYIDADVDNPKLCRGITGAQDYCGPSAYPPLADRLFRNRGDGTFEDVTRKLGLRSGFGPALGAVATDFNGDGRLDLYVANDQTANQLWVHQGDGTFKDEALFSGAAVNAQGRAEASMGVDAADFDGDGDEDLFMTHLIGETNTLYVNEGAGTFIDRSVQWGLASPSRLYTAFGTVWLDVDRDGRLDLFVANGAVKAVEQLAAAQDPFPYHHPNQLFQNRGDGDFEDVSSRAGEAFSRSEVSRGVALGDLDNDGDHDLIVANNNGPARLLLGRAPADRPWLGLDLRRKGRALVGARASLELGDGTVLWRRARRDGSFAGSSDPRILFGWPHGEVRSLRVLWPNGRESVHGPDDITIGSYMRLEEPGSAPSAESGAGASS